MLLNLNRFMTTAEVKRDYQVPDEVAEDILPSLPVVIVKADGSCIHLESEVDEFLIDYVRGVRQAESQASPLVGGKPGRKVETLEIALYADKLRRDGKIWKEVWLECRKRWPGSEHVRTSDQIRATHRRHIGKAREKTN